MRKKAIAMGSDAFPRPAKNPFVEDRQEIIENRTVGIEQLIEKDKLSFRQHPCDDGGDRSFAEFDEIDGAKEFIGFREASQQILKVSTGNGLAEWARIKADFAVPGGPYRNRCSPATSARAMRSTTSSASDEAMLERSDHGSLQVRRDIVVHGRFLVYHFVRTQLLPARPTTRSVFGLCTLKEWRVTQPRVAVLGAPGNLHRRFLDLSFCSDAVVAGQTDDAPHLVVEAAVGLRVSQGRPEYGDPGLCCITLSGYADRRRSASSIIWCPVFNYSDTVTARLVRVPCVTHSTTSSVRPSFGIQCGFGFAARRSAYNNCKPGCPPKFRSPAGSVDRSPKLPKGANGKARVPVLESEDRRLPVRKPVGERRRSKS